MSTYLLLFSPGIFIFDCIRKRNLYPAWITELIADTTFIHFIKVGVHFDEVTLSFYVLYFYFCAARRGLWGNMMVHCVYSGPRRVMVMAKYDSWSNRIHCVSWFIVNLSICGNLVKLWIMISLNYETQPCHIISIILNIIFPQVPRETSINIIHEVI